MPITYKEIEVDVTATPSINPVFDSQTTAMDNLEEGCYSVGYGFQLCWNLDINAMIVRIEFKFGETSLGKWILDTTHTCTHIGVNVGVAGASLDFCVNWDQREITLKGEAHFLMQSKEFDVVLFVW